MFARYNRAFLAEQREPAADVAMARRGADRLLADAGVRFRSLPGYFRVDPATHAALVEATGVLVGAQQKLLCHLRATRSTPELAAMFRVPPEMAARLDWDGVASSGLRMLRADIVPTDSGYAFCELNHFSGVGGGEAYHSARAFAELLGRPVAGVSPFRELAQLYRTECERAGLTRLVILDSARHRGLGYGQHRLLQDYLRLMAPELEIAYRDERDYPPEWLRPGEASRTLVHRLFTLGDVADGGAFLAAVRDNGATVACMFEAELKMHRTWFSLLCDPGYRQLLDERERAAVDRYLPYSVDLRPDNLDEVLADKDGYVFKRSYSYGGQGVILGADRTRDEVRQALLADGVEAWACQRRVSASTVDLPAADGRVRPHHLVLGMYVYGDRSSGLLVRGSAASPVVNASRGGGVSWAFVG